MSSPPEPPWCDFSLNTALAGKGWTEGGWRVPETATGDVGVTVADNGTKSGCRHSTQDSPDGQVSEDRLDLPQGT